MSIFINTFVAKKHTDIDEKHKILHAEYCSGIFFWKEYFSSEKGETILDADKRQLQPRFKSKDGC
jgi:hypothetical protein